MQKFFSQDHLMELKMKKALDSLFQDKFSCIESLKRDNELLKQSMQTTKKKLQELENEVERLKDQNHRRFRRTLDDILKIVRPQQSWLEFIHSWRDTLTAASLEAVFTATTFLETFLQELKKLRPTVISLTESVPLPNRIEPLLCVRQGNKKVLHVWDQDAEVWTPLQYNHLKKLITLYIYRIRELWLQWQEQNQHQMRDYSINEKYNSYIAKPVTDLYKESYKQKMFQIFLSTT